MHTLSCLLIFFFLNYSLKNLSEIVSGCKTVLIQIRPDILSGLLMGQNCFKDYQQATKLLLSGKELTYTRIYQEYEIEKICNMDHCLASRDLSTDDKR